MITNSSGERPNIKIKSQNLNLDLEQVPAMVRYIFGLKFFTQGCSVLDIGSGYGHGVLFQSLYANKVTGVGISVEALSVANEIKKLKNLSNINFVKGIESVNGVFDIITAFEIIEHIEKDEGLELIKKAKSLLNKDGTFIVSTPYIDIRGKTYWRYHKHEYFNLELKNILKKYYKYVECYYHLGDGFYIKKGFLKSLLVGGNLSSASSLIFVCSDRKKSTIQSSNNNNFLYLLLRGIYRNSKFLLFGK